MNDDSTTKAPRAGPSFAQQVGAKAALKLKARRSSTQGVWLGLGMMGLVGWSVVVPTLLGAALGIWLDEHHPGKHTWTLALLVAGLAIGCLNACIGWPRRTGRCGTSGREKMNETRAMVLAWAAGLFLGAVFFGGLWWTVRKDVSSKHPATLFFSSLLLRMSILLAGLYLVGHEHW